MAAKCTEKKYTYIYDLPLIAHVELCKLLNQNGAWEELAGKWMQYDMTTIKELNNEKNPTEGLLDLWSRCNHKIVELFALLYQMQHYQAMLILKPFVESKYHRLIDRGEGNARALLGRRKTPPKDSKIGIQNFNQVQPVVTGVQKIVIHDVKDTVKIINKPALNQVAPSNSNNLLVVTPVVGSRLSPLPGRATVSSVRGNGFSFGKEATLPQIPYPELTMATDNWNPKLILGKGGFGTVFRGLWKNTEVAVKKIERRGPESEENYMQQLQQSLREITILNSRPHENILSLYAFSMGGDAPCLVYQFMANGSLADRLQRKQGTTPLTWLQRHEIAKGTARGLQYLHTIGEKPLIHGDIKSANILLDKNFEPRIGDFGLASEGSEHDSMKVSKIQGTRPYLPDDFLIGKNLSTKIDTYSYGVVMFELATALPIYDDTRPDFKYLKDFVNNWMEQGWEPSPLMDKTAGTRNMEVYNNLMVLGKWCCNRLAKDRPEMAAVYQKLNANLLYRK